MAQEKNGVVIICIELTKGADLRNGHLYGWLEQLARSGKIDVLLAGPPCRSVSVCRLRSLEGDDGPKIVRARHGSERFGRHDLTEEELKLVCNDNLLWMRTLWLAVQAYEANQNLEITLEQPQDPEQWKQPPADIKEKIPGWNGFPSFLAWPETEVMVKKCKLRRISFHQGALGHQTNKPTTVLTSTEELFDLQGLMSRGSSKEWPSDLNKRLELSSSLASWAPGLKNLLVKGINRVNTQTPAVCALSAVEQRQIKEWQLHVSNGHKPFRRDCAVCLEGAGRDRPRRRLQHPESYTLSIDLSGPHKKGIDQRGRPTYFMVAVYTVPVQDSFPLPEGLQQVAGGEKRRLQPPEGSPLDRDDLLEQFEKELEENLARAVAPQDLEQEDQAQAPQPGEDQEKKPEEEKDAIKKKDEDQKEGDDPWEIVPHRHEDLTAAEIRWWDVKDQFWKEKIAELQDVEVRNLTFAVPMQSRHSREVVRAVQEVYMHLRTLQLPVLRLHSDRAREFTGVKLRDWCTQRDILQTSTAGDESAGNGRCESELGIIQAQTRVQLRAAGLEANWWPLALRHTVEQRQRDQMASMGITLPPLIPFGTECFAKLKRWHRRDWDHPFEKIRVLGPAMGMSTTSKGYYIQSLSSGKFMRSTVVVVPGTLPDVLPQLPEPSPDDYAPSYLPEDEAEDHLQDDVEEPMEICPEEVVQQLHADQGGAEVQVHVLNPRHQVVPTPGELHLADGSRPRRLHGKQHVDLLPPSVSKLLWTTTGGSGLDSVVDHELSGEQQLQKPEIRRYLDHLQQLCLLQHHELCRLRREETQVGDYDMMGETLKDIDDEVQRLEGALRGLAKLEPMVKEQETLVTKTLTLDEVRRELEEWKEPIKSEYESLLKHKAIEPINKEQYQELQRTHDIEVIPGKLVATIKPPFKRKARLVACGNQASKNEDAEVAAGGLCTVCTRSLVSKAAQNEWGCATVDVKTAFLQAPRREEKGKLTLVTPPAITKEAQVCGQEWWLVKGALYGLVESPKDWAVYRDATCKTISWKGETGQHRRLAPTPEPHVWSIEEMEKASNGEKWFVIGNMGVYVDDLLLVAPNNILEETLGALEERFTLATPEWVTGEKTVTFCGYEISKTDQGYALGQEKYIRDLMDKHNIKQTAGVPCPKVEEGPEEPAENLQGPVLRAAQQLCGELMWLTTRTRPDVAYTVGVMSRLLHKRPGYVVEVGQQCLKYLCGSASKKLQYKGGGPIDVLEVMVDASFGPPHEGYRSVQGIMMTHGGNPIMWASTRQPFITQSTAEAELLAYNEAYQNGESTGALLEVLGYGGVKKHMQGDSKSGISQLTSDTGAWRTRHLRLRSAKLREVVQDPEEPWTVSHCSGLELGADGLTKPLQGQAFTSFLGLIGMAEDEEVSVSKVMGPSWTSSTTASSGFNTKLEGVGAAVMGVGALLDSEPLVLGGLAMVAVSLYRQRYGVQKEQEGFDLHHGGDLLPGDEFAEAYEPQLDEKRKDENKSLKTTRLAKRPQKDHKSGQPPKGNLDEAAHPPHPQSRASTAEGSKENLGCDGSQSSFPGYGGVAHVPGCSSTDRARPCASNGVESSRPPKGALQEQSMHVTGAWQSVHEMPRMSALRWGGDPGDPIEDFPDESIEDDPIEEEEPEVDPGIPFPHGDPHGNAYLRQLGQVPPNYKAPPAQWMQQHAPKAALPKARPKRRAEVAQPKGQVEEAQPKRGAEVLQPKQRAEAFLRAAERGSLQNVERGHLHQVAQGSFQKGERSEQGQQCGASASSSTSQQGEQQPQSRELLPRDPREDEQLEDSSGSEKGKGSGFVSTSPKISPKGKGYPKGSTMSSETQNMSTTPGGTSLGQVADGLESFDGERVAVLTSLRPGSNIDGQPPPALRFFAVMSDGGKERGDRGRQEDRDDRSDRGAPGKVIERCPGKPKPKSVSLRPAPSLVTLRPASQASRVPDDEVHYVEESSSDEEKGNIRRVVLDDEKGFSSGDDAAPVRMVQTEGGQASSSAGLGAGKPEHGEGQLPEAALQPEVPERQVVKEEGPKLKKYRRVRVKKKAPQLEKDIQVMQDAQRTRNERMACLRILQQQRNARKKAAEPQKDKKPEVKAEEPKEPQPRTPSPSSVDWKAAEKETERQFAEAKAAGRRILSYEEWDEERKKENEKKRQERLRKSWVDREIARRALQQEKGATREAVLRSTTTSAAGPLTDEEWLKMQEMMKRLPPAPEKPKKDEEQPQDKRAKTLQKDPKHGMQPPPPPPGYAGVWRGGCCPGFRWQGGQQGQFGPHGPQQQQGFWPGCGGQPQQHVPQGGPQGCHTGLQGQVPVQQSMSLDLGPVRYRTQEELEEATQWLQRWRGGPEVDLRSPGDIVRHDLAMAMARPRPKEGTPARPTAEAQATTARLPAETPATQAQPPAETPAGQQDQQPARETLLQRVLRLSEIGALCSESPRTLSSTSEAEILEEPDDEVQEVQYDETNRAQNEQMALRPKARPPLRRDPRHGAMAAAGGDGGRDPGEGDNPPHRDSGSPEPEAEGSDEEEDIHKAGKKNKYQMGKNSAWIPHKLRKGRGFTVQFWPEKRGCGTRSEGADATVIHSATSLTLGWQQVYAKGKQPRALRVTNQAGKASGGRVVMKGKGTNPAAELQLAQSLNRAATAIRRAETAVETFGNGSEGAEAAYEEAADAVTSFLEADAALHPPSGASSSSAARASSNSAAAAVGKGAANLGLSAYRDFVANKGKGKGKMCRAQPEAATEDEEGSDQEADLDGEHYEEEIEEEEVREGSETSVEVELEVIQEEEESDLPAHGEGQDDDLSQGMAENGEPAETDYGETEAFDDGQGPVSEPEVEAGDLTEESASLGITATSSFISEEEAAPEEHD